MIDKHVLIPHIKQAFPQATDSQIKQGLEMFMKEHPNMTNIEALIALNQAAKGMPQQPQKGAFSDVEGALDKPQQEQ